MKDKIELIPGDIVKVSEKSLDQNNKGQTGKVIKIIKNYDRINDLVIVSWKYFHEGHNAQGFLPDGLYTDNSCWNYYAKELEKINIDPQLTLEF